MDEHRSTPRRPSPPIKVTKLHRAEHGELDARVSINGTTVPVTRRFGSWTTQPDKQGRFRDLVRPIPAVLEARARRYKDEQHG